MRARAADRLPKRITNRLLCAVFQASTFSVRRSNCFCVPRTGRPLLLDLGLSS